MSRTCLVAAAALAALLAGSPDAALARVAWNAASPSDGPPSPGTPPTAAPQVPGTGVVGSDPDAAARAGAAPAADEAPPEDMVLSPAQPEFTLVHLPTTLRMPRHRFAFRVSHRFTRDLGRGSFDDLLADFFGFDGGAQIGLELRFGLARGWQAGVYRTSDRTIQLFTQYAVVRQGDRSPITVDALATLEGTNNLARHDDRHPEGDGQRSPALGAVVSRAIGRAASVSATLAWVNNANPFHLHEGDHDDTVLLGIGGRLRIRPTVYVVAEIAPRLAGHAPNSTQAAFGLEKRVGGHAFQVSVSNGIGSTLAQVARGGDADRWYIGFNINRKFF